MFITQELRAHPAAQLILHAANGSRGLPTRADLDELGLPAYHRDRVSKACAAVARKFDSGEQAEARQLALEWAASVVSGLPEGLRDVRPRDPLAGVDDPAALAAAVPAQVYRV